MGVQGLWQVLQPCARPTNLATLNRKRLAVDASIWIYQFLKAVRDKEGNALRNSHVVGFFRRICKLLWFGIKPVFVFDGGAPALKRATLQGRRRRREGRREDAVRTAGKLLAVQMQRIAAEEDERRKAARARGQQQREEEEGVAEGEELPDMENMVYAEEAFTAKPERQKNRKFFRQDQYHLPDLETSIDAMGKSDDPRIMSVEELEEYARQFNSGEDVNLYDFSKIDFDGEFFKSLPPADRYNILNAARLRSRLRMGLSKEQLDVMFPNRMDFSRFQVERVQERNRLTQRLMAELKMTGLDLTINGGGRIAGDKNREYILVKNEGVEGGYALGVVTQEKDLGEQHKPIDVDALQLQFATKDDDEEWEDEEDFEDVPIEGLNRLPKRKARVQDEDSLFVNNDDDADALFVNQPGEDQLMADEDEDVARAIELSLRNQHGVDKVADEPGEEEFEDVLMPQWEQKAVEAPKPIKSTSGAMVAHIINNRANASVPKKRPAVDDDSDSEEDLQAALAAARRKKKKTEASKPKPRAPILPNIKNPFGGPLPFEKLDWRTSIFEKKPKEASEKSAPPPKEAVSDVADTGGGFQIEIPPEGEEAKGEEAELEGGFEKGPKEDDAPRPLPPWMIHDETDIRDKVKEQRRAQNEINEEDERLAMEEERLRRKRRQDELIEIESSDDDDSDIEIVEAPPVSTVPLARAKGSEASIVTTEPFFIVDSPQKDSPSAPAEVTPKEAQDHTTHPSVAREDKGKTPDPQDEAPVPSGSPGIELEDVTIPEHEPTADSAPFEAEVQDEPEDVEFEDVELPQVDSVSKDARTEDGARGESEEPIFEDVVPEIPSPAQQEGVESIAPVADPVQADDGLFADGEYDEFSDPEEEQLLAQMAEEAEEHARFASELNNKPAYQNQEDYERELRALRTQQKKDRRDADEVTQIMVTECQALLRLFGIPYITAAMEAEAQCAELVHLGLVDGIVTDDSDIFLFGGTRVYKNMFNSNKFVECYLGADLEKELSLSRENLISIAHLLGSDYTEGIPGIGPVTAIEILSEFPGREGLVHFRDWWADVQAHPGRAATEADAAGLSAFRRKFRKTQATKLFLPTGFPSPAVYDAYLQPDVDKSPETFQWGVPDLEGLRRFLMATIGWSPERTDEVLVPVIRDMNRRDIEGTQSNITRFFEGSVGVGAKEAFAPRTRQKGSRRMAAAVDRLRAKNTGKNGSIAEEEEEGEGENAEEVDASAATTAAGSNGSRKRKGKARATAVVESEGDDENDNGDDGNFDDAREAQGTGKRKSTGKRAKGKGKGKAKGRGNKAKA